MASSTPTVTAGLAAKMPYTMMATVTLRLMRSITGETGHGRHDGAVPGAFGIAQQAVVHVGVVLLPREKLGDLHAGDALVEVGVHIAAFVGVRLPPSALHGLDEQDEPDGERRPASTTHARRASMRA